MQLPERLHLPVTARRPPSRHPTRPMLADDLCVSSRAQNRESIRQTYPAHFRKWNQLTTHNFAISFHFSPPPPP